jgi:hypothetical protein
MHNCPGYHKGNRGIVPTKASERAERYLETEAEAFDS